MSEPRLHPAVKQILVEWLNSHHSLFRVIFDEVASQMAPMIAMEATKSLACTLSGENMEKVTYKLAMACLDAKNWFCDMHDCDVTTPARTDEVYQNLALALQEYRLLANSGMMSDMDPLFNDQVAVDEAIEGGDQ